MEKDQEETLATAVKRVVVGLFCLCCLSSVFCPFKFTGKQRFHLWCVYQCVPTFGCHGNLLIHHGVYGCDICHSALGCVLIIESSGQAHYNRKLSSYFYGQQRCSVPHLNERRPRPAAGVMAVPRGSKGQLSNPLM